MIIRIVPIAPVVSTNFETIRTAGTMHLDRLKDKRLVVVSDVSRSGNEIFAIVSVANNPNMIA